MSTAKPKQKTKVAILGGGCGAMTAAGFLSSTPELREQYEVTVYQVGWRLGGKGATGRDARDGYGDRIYEHGLHMWLGWYQNAFRMIQSIYAERPAKPSDLFQTWTDAFAPQRFFTIQQDITDASGTRWVTRNIHMPQTPGTPGQSSVELILEELFRLLADWMHRHFKDSPLFAHKDQAPSTATLPSTHQALLELLKQTHSTIVDDSHTLLHSLRVAAHGLFSSSQGQSAHPLQTLHEIASHYLGEFQQWLRSPEISSLSSQGADLKWAWQMFDFVTTVGKGMVNDVLPKGPAGIEAINQEDFVAWITRHGASASTQWSAFTRAIYNLAFSFDGGIADRDHARFEAGTALLVYLRMALGYKDAPMWRMIGGMGDTIFAPIYQVLSKRGVKFQFFHRATNLQLSADKKQIAGIEMDVQAKIKGGVEYSPLYEITFPTGKTLQAWPDEPDWNQIEDAADLQAQLAKAGLTFNSGWCNVKTGTAVLKQGVDFDHVVLGISLAGLPSITPELCAASPTWNTMVTSLRTVETLAMQLWMQPALKDLGWNGMNTIMTTYAEPFDTWGEMSDVLPQENWSGTPSPPQSLHYFCGPMPGPAVPPLSDPTYPAMADAKVKQTAFEWLNNHIEHIWPKATPSNGSGGFDFNLLHDPAYSAGTARLDSQYIRANIDPSERYVASFPGTSKLRLRSDQSGFANLFLAGDWAVSSVNGGCVEAAVEAGMAASRGICGVPAQIPAYPPAPSP